MERAVIEALYELKARELCTSGEAFGVIRETRALLKLHEEVKKELPDAPTLPLSHIKAFCDVTHHVADLKIRTALVKRLPEKSLSVDIYGLYAVEELSPPPTRSENYTKERHRWKLDFKALYSTYVQALIEGEQPRRALIETALMLSEEPVFFESDGTKATLSEILEPVVIEPLKFPLEIEGLTREEELQHIGECIFTDFREYDPSIDQGPEMRLEINYRSLFERARNDYTLGTSEIERKIALNLMRSFIHILKAEKEDFSDLEKVFQLVLRREREAIARRAKRLEGMKDTSAWGWKSNKEGLFEAQYYVRVLLENKAWLMETLSR